MLPAEHGFLFVALLVDGVNPFVKLGGHLVQCFGQPAEFFRFGHIEPEVQIAIREPARAGARLFERTADAPDHGESGGPAGQGQDQAPPREGGEGAGVRKEHPG